MPKTPITNYWGKSAKNASINEVGVYVTLDNTEALTNYIKAFRKMKDTKTLKEMGLIAKNTFNEYVPKRHGDLRRKAKVKIKNDSVTVDWNTVPYARYQYFGEIYDFNHVRYKNGVVAGWYSSAEKKPSGRYMVPNFRYTLYTRGNAPTRSFEGKLIPASENPRRYICRLGYTTPNTGHHWIEEIINNPTKYVPMKRKMTRLLYEKFQKEHGGRIVGT